jgi:hypothetical protein
LHLFYGGEFQTFLIGNNLITLSYVKIEPFHTSRTKPTRNCSFSQLRRSPETAPLSERCHNIMLPPGLAACFT